MMPILLFVFLHAIVLVTSQDEPCKVPNGKLTCVCDTGSGVIDLTSMSYSDGNPFFAEFEQGKDNQYFYNPCQNFFMGFTDCYYGDTGVCQEYQTDSGPVDVSCGTASSEQMVNRNGDYYLLYSDGTSTGEGERSSEVKLICDPNAEVPEFTAYGDNEVQLVYKFDLTSKCACPGTCIGSTPPTDPDSPPTDRPGGGGGKGSSVSAGAIGIVLMILIPAALVTYFIVGAILLKYKFGKTGTDIIPQKGFWFALPVLVKDGCVFTFSPLVKLIRRERGYDKI